MKNYNSIYIFLLFTVICYSCANVIPLEGGPKDTTPPKAIKYTPDTFSVNFNAKKIVIGFDEFVVVKNANKEVTLSPPVGVNPIVQSNGKSIEIIFQDSLKLNTTYTIQFGNSIADNNEGNVLQGFSYVFSTGSVLDSLSAKSVLLDAYTLKPLSNAKWLLYPEINDSTVFKDTPYYLGYSNSNGNVSIQYMKSGTFEQIALQESNNNNIYNPGEEWIGFTDKKINSGDSVIQTFYLFKERPEKVKIRSSRILEKGKIGFKFSAPVDTVFIEPLTDSIPGMIGHFEFLNEDKDTALYWYPAISEDTLFFNISFLNQSADTVRVTEKKTTTNGGGGNRNNLNPGGTGTTTTTSSSKLTFTSNTGSSMDYFKKIILEFSNPVVMLDTNGIILLEQNKQIPVIWEYEGGVNRKIKLLNNLKQGVNYTLMIKDSALIDNRGIYNDSIKTNFKTSYEREYADLKIITFGADESLDLIFLLLNNEDKIIQKTIVKSREKNHTAVFSNLTPGSYRVKIIYDQNGNGKWDTGNYLKKIQPEKVAFFPENITINPGFDAEYNWDLNLTNSIPINRGDEKIK